MHKPESVLPPAIAQGLGYVALLPFVAGALALWWSDGIHHAMVASLLSASAAAVLSFIGGIHWGLALRQPQPRLFVWGVVPSIMAWAAQMLPPARALLCHVVMLVVCCAVDRQVYASRGAQAWLPLRLQLTAVAAVCCLIGAAALALGARSGAHAMV